MGATQHQYYMNMDFIVSEVKYSLVYEEPMPEQPRPSTDVAEELERLVTEN